ncbi:metallophosphoesterase family protein [Singulisphaera acidiphila]|uniref:Putative phosphoesterase n=1 Tax=Singulisphaera acidiphila (strain ATCC BAA-1392 / DSM 18658 / VKM B-2454 / MOB10) TaxID=886293 RepID=L0DG18_SINAD|nr:metallophosphoesterase family protein [Singulisphaera acidiphila]AGA28319.1 putative phosphoesterase [Singulisphaera acidiphila DSM 18658]
MKIVILSDVHGNYEALRALPEEYDELWVLGDLVGYGPQPCEVIDEVRAKAKLTVRGNHDHAAVHPGDRRWRPRYRATAEATCRYTASVLDGAQRGYLGGLPLWAESERDGTRFYLTHATPSDPLYGRCATVEAWAEEVGLVTADVVLVGHTHTPSVQRIGGRLLVNPGSLGQPKSGRSAACYAVWQDGRIDLRSFEYPVEATVERLRALRFPRDVEEGLVRTLRTGIDGLAIESSDEGGTLKSPEDG